MSSTIQRVECRGAPRDLGFDQGAALRDAVREEWKQARREAVGGAWRWLRFGKRRAFRRRVRDLDRDLARHFPQQADRLAGLAAGARISRRKLVAPLVRELADAPESSLRVAGGLVLAVASERGPGRPLIAGTFDLAADRRMPFIVRESRPDHGYASVELALPWMASALAGVNETGFAIAVATGPSTELHQQMCRAPGIHLLQDCLQNCDDVEKAIEWCEKRPSGGVVSLLFADATGVVAGIVTKSDRRTVLRADSGLLVGLAHPDRRATVDEACQSHSVLDPDVLHGLLADHGIGDDEEPDRASAICRHGAPTETYGSFLLDVNARRMEIVAEPPCRADRGSRAEFTVSGNDGETLAEA